MFILFDLNLSMEGHLTALESIILILENLGVRGFSYSLLFISLYECSLEGIITNKITIQVSIFSSFSSFSSFSPLTTYEKIQLKHLI